MNWPTMAPHGLVLSRDGATPPRMLFRRVLGLFDTIFNKCLHNMEAQGLKNNLGGQQLNILGGYGPIYRGRWHAHSP